MGEFRYGRQPKSSSSDPQLPSTSAPFIFSKKVMTEHNDDHVGRDWAAFIIVVAIGTGILVAHHAGFVDAFINSFLV
jgi:hypothetical protein